jgi:murein DD-endopeptidase MepM/ murein hydrolase activator NlpD
VLELLQEFADRIEEESPAAAQAFSSGYLHDGKTRADWEAQLAAVYAGYNKLQARIESIRQIVTDNDGEVNPIALMPPRIEWRLVVTGRPAGGGAPVTVLEITSRLGGNEELFWIGREHGHFVFVGDGATEPFRIAMPILPGDEARAAFGIWPFGVHGGGHPEGHPGWDVEYQAGGRVRAAAGGVIVQIEPNGSIAGQSRIRIRHRPGYETVYDHVGALESGIVAGATVAMGQALAEAGDVGPSGSPFYITHFAVSVVADAMCPAPFLSTDGLAVFNTVWTTAAYAEELAEPFPCNPVVVTFPLGRTWSRTVGSLAPQIVFTRTDPNTTDYRYALLDAAGGTTELGSVVNLQPLALPTAGYLDLQPDEGGAPHLGIYNILDGQMSIDWGASRPADLSSASVYGSSPPGP